MSVRKREGRPNKPWEARYYDEDGNQHSVSFALKGQADEFDRKQASSKYTGEFIGPDRENMTVAAFYADVYLPTRAVCTATRKGIEARWSPKRKDPAVWHVGMKWGAYKLTDANRKEAVLKWHGEMRKAGAPASTIHRAHDLFVAIMKEAYELEYLSRSRVLGIRPPYKAKQSRKDGPWLPCDIEDIRAYYMQRFHFPPKGSASKGGGVRGARILTYKWARRRDAELASFLGYQGCRPGEALALRWERILDDDRRSISGSVHFCDTITEVDDDEDRDERTKTGKDRVNPLDTFVRADLAEWWLYVGRPKRGLVFPLDQDGRGWTRGDWSNWRRGWVKALKACDLEYRAPKHLRHSYLSMLIREGRDIGTVADLAGHSLEVCMRDYRQAFQRHRLDPSAPFNMHEAIALARADMGQMWARDAASGDDSAL